jgi:endonuclease YncB( thermonuclease family)
MRSQIRPIVTASIIVLAVLSSLAASESISIDSPEVVAAVIDGSSFQIVSGGTIKLAAVDTPNSGQPGYLESKNYLTTLIQGKTIYLDTGLTATTDQQSRLLCIVYIEYNSTYYENVNMAMIQNGYAVPNSTNNNGFDPGTWTWFVLKQAPTSIPSEILTPQASATPTPTPFSQPIPSISPTISELSTNITFLIIVLLSLIVSAQLYIKKKK